MTRQVTIEYRQCKGWLFKGIWWPYVNGVPIFDGTLHAHETLQQGIDEINKLGYNNYCSQCE